MIKSVAKAIQTYSMSTFDVPSKVCDNLDVLNKKFWWNSKNSNGKYLACNKLCHLKSRGALGFKKRNEFEKRNVTTTNYFTIFLQTVVVANFYWFSFESFIDISFSFTNNHSPH